MVIHGFELVRDEMIAEINSRAKIYRHVKTGARLLSLENDDENKVFGVAFATPPEDSTGVPHILEHSVLGGSAKYPVKDPFKELRKSSLNTFLNAFTSSDMTVYPVASQNKRDLYNLAAVYLDAVFHPLLARETWQEEGWHYEMENPAAPLTYRGIVFNEMKGNYSDPDSLIGEYSQRSLFPDTVYSRDSGGDPKVIPSLTYEQFVSFHSRYYHPSNSFIFFYGDDHSDERLRMVDDVLTSFAPAAPAPAVPLQTRFSAVQRFSYPYDAGSDGDHARKGYVMLNWMLHEVSDVQTSLALEILSHALVGTQASPLRKALIDSQLGEDLIGGGFSDSYRQATFSTGLKGMAVEDAAKVEQLILDTLRKLAAEGIERDMILASLNTLEFRLRELNTGGFPRGLVHMFNAFHVWQHGGDPLEAISFERPLAHIKAAYARDQHYFSSLIEQLLLANLHRTVVVLKPDAKVGKDNEAEEMQRLTAARAAMSDADVAAVLSSVEGLRRRQNTPDAPDALATIPTLTLADLDPKIRQIPTDAQTVAGAPLLYHDLFTNGIVYLDLAFDLRSLPPALLPYAGLLGRLWTGMGTTRRDFVKLSQLIGQKTGGIGAGAMTATSRDRSRPLTWLIMRGKATTAQAGDLLAIVREILLEARMDNRERLRQIVLSEKARMESSLMPGGSGVVYARLRSHFSVADWAGEQMGGVEHLFFLRRLAERIESDWPAVLADLQQVQRLVVNRASLLGNVTVDQASFGALRAQLNELVGSLPQAPVVATQWAPELSPTWEALTLPAQVNHVGKGALLYDLGYIFDGSALVIVQSLNAGWLWEKVRVQGGAYGGSCAFDDLSGMLAYISYRDPNLLGTLDVYDKTAEFLRSVPMSDDDLARAIIGTIGRLDAYQLPDAKGYSALLRYLTGTTDEIRQRIRDQVLSTSVADFRDFAGVLDAVARQGVVCVMGAEQAVTTANASLGGRLKPIKVM